jgi:hypothetical protein
MNQLYLGTGRLAPDLADNLAASNPHWFGKPSKPYPSFHRTVFAKLYRLLTGAALSPAVALRGPRRVGKTVLLQQVVARLLADGVRPERVFYVTFDELPSLAGLKEPVLAVARWFEQQRLGRTFNEAARADEPAYLLFDEIQNLRDWAPQLKHLVDTQAVRVLVTGSSSLRIEAGRDSIAGRVTTLDLSPLTLREIAGLREGGEATPYWIDNGLGVLARRDFWLDGRARADAEREARQRIRSLTPTHRPPGKRWRASSTRRWSSGPSGTTCASASVAGSGTNSCSRKCSAPVAATPARRRGPRSSSPI